MSWLTRTHYIFVDAAYGQGSAFSRASSGQSNLSRLYICVVCLQRFLSEESLGEHFKTVNNHGYINSCSKCGKVFKSPKGYDYHIKMQHGKKEGSVVCPVCGVSVYDKATLRTHMIKHSDVRRFECSKCGKTFKHKMSHSSHVKNCAGTKNFWKTREKFVMWEKHFLTLQ